MRELCRVNLDINIDQEKEWLRGYEYAKTMSSPNVFKIEKVIFNDPATIILWKDGTKTVVKCGENDIFDKEKGVALCFMKKIHGNKGNIITFLKNIVRMINGWNKLVWLPD